MTSEPLANIFLRLYSDLSWFGSEQAVVFQVYFFNILHKRVSI